MKFQELINIMMSDRERIWDIIVRSLQMNLHNFDKEPFHVEHKKIKKIVSSVTDIPNNVKEIRLLGNHITRERRPHFFRKNNLFLLPASNRSWNIIKGDGYFDLPLDNLDVEKFNSNLKFELDTLDDSSTSESKYISQAFSKGIIQHFTSQNELFLTLNGRKYTTFNFKAYGHELSCNKIQIEIDAGYETKDEVILIEAKSAGKISNEVIRQLYFPRKYVSTLTTKKIRNIFFVVTDKGKYVNLYEYDFKSIEHYESIYLVNSKRYKLA